MPERGYRNLACFFILFSASRALGTRLRDDEEKLIGWKGNSYIPKEKAPWVQTLSWRPRAFLFRNFISEIEAKHIAETAWPRMEVLNRGYLKRLSKGSMQRLIHESAII